MGQGKEAKYLIRRDKVKVPKNIPKGDYALSFRWIFMSSHAFALKICQLFIFQTKTNRWDAEGAAQVWVSCAFVKLV